MEKRGLKISLLLTALSLLALCVALTAATYAWFTFDPYTNVTPMEGRISEGDTNLLISEGKTGPFDKQCALNPAHLAKTLFPVSTPDLDKFYTSRAQNAKGISTHFKDVTEKPGEYLIHGTVYLKCMGAGCGVYFNKPPLDLGTENQVLAAGRLGLKITGKDGKAIKYIFSLDALGNTQKADAFRTVETDKKKAVIGKLDASGNPEYSDDPAVSINGYILGEANAEKLCALSVDEIAEVEYWLYLEGCDDECCNAVQSTKITLALGFVGSP